MHKFLRILLLAGLTHPATQAQSSNGYAFFAPGAVTCCGYISMTLQFGFGGEAVLGKGIGIGAELSALGVREGFTDNVVGVFSPNGYYHFIHAKKAKADPFVTGGYTMIFRNGHANLFNFGGGVNYWFHSHLGARLELRDQVHTNGSSAIHYWGVRFGLAFR
jgi:hypothetical protein